MGSWKPEEVMGVEVMSSCKLLDVGAERQTLVLLTTKPSL